MKLLDSLTSFTRGLAGYRDKPFAGLWGGGVPMSWLMRQAVYRIPEDCFRKGYSWYADPEQIARLESLEKQHKIRDKKRESVSMARLDGEAYIYFDVASGSPSQELRLDNVRAGSLRFVNVISRSNVNIGELEKDPMSPFYNQPKYYELSGGTGASVRIHPSRIARFVCNKDPFSHLGTSILDSVNEVICSAISTRENVVALVHQARVWVLGVDGLGNKVSDPREEELLRKRYMLFNEMLSTNALALTDKDGEVLTQQSAQFGTLPDVIESMRREVAAALDIPYALLFGRSGGIGTNGEMDLKEYYDNISVIQRNAIDGPCEILDEVIIRSALGNRPDEVYHMWDSLWQDTGEQKASIGKTIADTVKGLVDSGVIPADVLTQSTVNALVENGSLPGLEQSYQEWLNGTLVTPDREEEDPAGDALGRADLPEDSE